MSEIRIRIRPGPARILHGARLCPQDQPQQLRILAGLVGLALLLPLPAVASIEADLLLAYAPSYAAGVGGDENAQVTLANAVIGSNFINTQSGTGARMRIAGYYKSVNDPVDWTTTGGMVGWLANNDSRIADVVAQGVAVAADLVTYVCKHSDSGSIAAVAQQPGMYSAHNPGAVWYIVFAHEIGGHNYGCSHADGLLNPKTVMLHNYCGGGAQPYFTNPSMYLNGVRLLGDGDNCGQGALISGGDNAWRVATAAQGVADRRGRVVAGPNLNHVVQRWSFTHAPGAAPAGTIITDEVGALPAVVRGNGAMFTGNGLRIPGGTTGNTAASSIAAYIDLPNGLLSAWTNLTIEIWATPLSAPNWARLCDFGRPAQAGDGLGAPGEYTGAPGTPAPGVTQSSDNLMLSLAIGTDLNRQRFVARLNGGGTITRDAGLATAAGAQYHYAITFTAGAGVHGAAGGRWQWYRDGDLITYLDVNFPLSAIEDVNNWLGRSMWSGDAMANAEYAEVRVSGVALAARQVLAHYQLGPNYFPSATVTLTNSDALGASSFSAAGNWSNGAPPSGAESYETLNFTLRTPQTGGSQTFAGGALRVSGGSLLYRGTSSSTINVNHLTLDGGMVQHGGSGTCTLAGNLTVSPKGGTINGVSGPINLSASLNGDGPLTVLANATTLSGANSAFTGKISVGKGVAGTLIIDSPAQLGHTPASFVADQLTFHRGTLQTTVTMALDDPNRGIRLERSGGRFNVGSGTTLTLASPLSTPTTPVSVVAGSITKGSAGTLILNSPGNSFRGSLYVDTGSTSANDGAVRVANNQVLATARSPIFIRNNNSGSSTLQLDGTTAAITLPQAVSLSGRNSSTPGLQNLAGTNTLAGGISINVGGANYRIQSDAGRLHLGGTISSAATGTRAFTFHGNGDVTVPGVIANGNATVSVNKTGPGTLTLAGNNTYSGTTTVSGGTLLVNGVLGAGGLTLAGGTTLGGNGTIASTVIVPTGATLSPGTSIGRLTVNNHVTLQAGSVMRMEISAAAQTNDLLQVSGTLTLGGTLVVTNLAGALAPGHVFNLFQAGTINAAFAGLMLPPLDSGLAWDTDTLATDGTLRVVSSIPDPPTLATSVTDDTLTLSWPETHIGWRLQVQTNAPGEGIGTNWVELLNTTGTNQHDVSLDPLPGSVFYRLVYP